MRTADTSFEAFYAAVNEGRDPFPWQARLAGMVERDGAWPSEIGVPTGMGKTSCLDIAIWALAMQAERPAQERTAPTRTWWLVNRRLLVDSTAAHARHVAAALADPEAAGIPDLGHRATLQTIGGKLRSLSADPAALPLEVVRLRGGSASGRPTDPSQPAILLTTLPMFGSRLLFRGYGSSRSMRPIDAALAGVDSLVLVDEAHLVRHLTRLAVPIAEIDQPAVDVLGPMRSRCRFTSLTATGERASDRFELDVDDEAHPVIKQRLDARKLLRLVENGPTRDTWSEIANATTALLRDHPGPVSCVVFTNTPATARAVLGQLERDLASIEGGVDLVQLTGRMREREASIARARVLDPEFGAPASRQAGGRARALVVVATQTLEVGADLDFDLLVTEACGVRALTQRLGRLNRLGRLDLSRAVYVHVAPNLAKGSVAPWPVYGSEPNLVLERLKGAVEAAGEVDVAPRSVAAVLGEPGDDPGPAPELLPAILDEWTKTTTSPEGEAPVEPYFAGIQQPDRRVSVCWRSHLPADGEQMWPRVRDHETIEVPISELVAAIEVRNGDLVRLSSDKISVEVVAPVLLRGGDTVLLGCSQGLYDEHGWSPGHTGFVADISVLENGIVLDAAALDQLVDSPKSLVPLVRQITEPNGDEEPDEESARNDVEKLLAALRAATPRALLAEEWLALLDDLDLTPLVPPDAAPRLVRRQAERDGRSDELDELSLSETAIDLVSHGAAVGNRARSVATAIGLSPGLCDTLAGAGRFHDAGKADRRFQGWLDPAAAASAPLAKSARPRSKWHGDRVASGWPAGGRHEALSARLAQAWSAASANGMTHEDIELLTHLIISHHGHGRPFLIPVSDATTACVTSALDGVDVTCGASLSQPDWDQPDRFWSLNERFGRWGLALLEAVVRQSDHGVSAGGWAGDMEVI